MFDLKPLSPGGVEAALKKAVRYRLLNEPFLAESICRDVLEVDPDNQNALITLILALADQFASEGGGNVADARVLIQHLDGEYEREYYAGIICERRGHAFLHRRRPGSGPVTYDWYRQAMEHYNRAQKLAPPGNDDAVLRWNTCARVISYHPELKPSEPRRPPVMLE